MNNQKISWISLNDYSSKYGVSISTLRRWIRKGKVSTQMHLGKYFLKNESPPGDEVLHQYKEEKKEEFKQIKRMDNLSEKNKGLAFIENTSSSLFQKPHGTEKTLREDSRGDKALLGVHKKEMLRELNLNKGGGGEERWVVLNRLLEIQSQLIQQLKEKNSQWESLNNQVGDLNTLVALLEEENRKLKTLKLKEKILDEWVLK